MHTQRTAFYSSVFSSVFLDSLTIVQNSKRHRYVKFAYYKETMHCASVFLFYVLKLVGGLKASVFIRHLLRVMCLLDLTDL